MIKHRVFRNKNFPQDVKRPFVNIYERIILIIIGAMTNYTYKLWTKQVVNEN